jgi:hypothetical protein
MFKASAGVALFTPEGSGPVSCLQTKLQERKHVTLDFVQVLTLVLISRQQVDNLCCFSNRFQR